MPAPLGHLYDLALRALDAQERRVAELRGRLAPVLAAAGIGTTLLSGPAIGAVSAGGALSHVALAVALVGLVVALGAATHLLASRKAPREVDLLVVKGALRARGGIADETTYFELMISALAIRHVRNERVVRHMHAVFTVMLCGILVELCGLALAALVA